MGKSICTKNLTVALPFEAKLRRTAWTLEQKGLVHISAASLEGDRRLTCTFDFPMVGEMPPSIGIIGPFIMLMSTMVPIINN